MTNQEGPTTLGLYSIYFRLVIKEVVLAADRSNERAPVQPEAVLQTGGSGRPQRLLQLDQLVLLVLVLESVPDLLKLLLALGHRGRVLLLALIRRC